MELIIVFRKKKIQANLSEPSAACPIQEEITVKTT